MHSTINLSQPGFIVTFYSFWVFNPGSETCEPLSGEIAHSINKKGPVWMTLKTYTHILTKCCPTVQLTSHRERTEVRAGLWWVTAPWRHAGVREHFTKLQVLLWQPFHYLSVFIQPLDIFWGIFCFWYSVFPAAGWLYKRLILTLVMCFCLAWERFSLWLALASLSGLPEGPGR